LCHPEGDKFLEVQLGWYSCAILRGTNSSKSR
jgi:hypothetical protein